MAVKDPAYEACVAKYRQLRLRARDQLEEEALRAFKIKVSVRTVDDDAEDAAAEWTGRRVGFDWRQVLKVQRKSHPDGLDLALWKNGVLCGLAVARLSDSKRWLSFTHIEGAAGNHPLKRKVVPLLIVGADIYASLVQEWDSAKRLPDIRILRPLEGAMEWYRKCGYSASHRVKCSKSFIYLTPPGVEP